MTKRTLAYIGLIIFSLLLLIFAVLVWEGSKQHEYQIAASSRSPATYTLHWYKQEGFVYDSYPPQRKLVLREEIRQDGQILFSRLTETDISGLTYGPGTPVPTGQPSGEYVTVTGYAFDLSSVTGPAELWACLHWQIAGQTSLFVEFDGQTPDSDGFYLVGNVNLLWQYYLPLVLKKGEL